jgi:hypothetical protein
MPASQKQWLNGETEYMDEYSKDDNGANDDR